VTSASLHLSFSRPFPLSFPLFSCSWGLHLVPENLSSVLESSARVNKMYETGAAFSLNLLMGKARRGQGGGRGQGEHEGGEGESDGGRCASRAWCRRSHGRKVFDQ
jgi:uncharacterized membrane protein YgcG